MAHSYAQHLELTCPECGARFKADMWLIVDGSERPDLVNAPAKANCIASLALTATAGN